MNFKIVVFSMVLTLFNCVQAMENVAPIVLTCATPVVAGAAGYMGYQNWKKAQLLTPEYDCCVKETDFTVFGSALAGVGLFMRAALFVYPYDPNNRFTMVSSAVPAAIATTGCVMQYCMNRHTSNLLALQNQDKRNADKFSEVIENV